MSERQKAGPSTMMGGGHRRGMLAAGRAQNIKGTLARLWGYLSRRQAGLIAVVLLTAAGSALLLAGPYLIGKAIDDYILPKDYPGLFRICMILLCVYIFNALMSWMRSYVMAAVSQRTVWEMRKDLFEQLQKLPVKFFDSKTHGELMSRTTNDIENVSTTLNQSVIQLLSSLITVTGAIMIMFSLNVWLALLSLISIPLTVLVTRNIARYTRNFFLNQQKHLGQLNGFIEEIISGQKVVKVFCREETSSLQFAQINTQLKNVGTKAQILSGMIPPLMNVVNHLGYVVIAGAGGWMAVNNLVSVGIVVSFLNYIKQFSRPINELANQFNLIQSAIAGAERVFEIMDETPEFQENQPGKEPENIAGEVILQDVCFGYQKDLPVLKNVSFATEPGSTVALVGPTGAGKTTIVNLLTRFYDIDSGSITIGGKNIQILDKKSLRKQLGIVLQDAYLFSDTIRENIRYGKLDATDAEIENAARLANADGFIRRLPQGYDTILTAEGSNLSHGQRQLITIARAILANPAILILDEATSNVDTRTEIHIQDALKILMQGRTSFVIAHRLRTIREADMILVINNGEVVERGNHEELLKAKGFYHHLYLKQFKKGMAM